MSKDSFHYSYLSTTRRRGGANSLVSLRLKSLLASHNLVGNFFHYRSAIKILGLDYGEVFEGGRLDLNPRKWADFGPLNFQLGPPSHVASALKKSITPRNITYYPPNIIPELKELVAKTVFKRRCGKGFEIMGTEGAQAAMAYSIFAFVNPGDEVLITDPGYFFLEPPIILAGGRAKRIILSKDNQYRIDLASLKKNITRRTKALIVCDPINPFGTVQSKEELEGIVRIANRHNIIVINNITHGFHRVRTDVRHYPMSSLKHLDLRNVITLMGLSHGFGLAGLRIGFLGGDPKTLEAVLAAKSALTRVNISLPMQHAALAALSDRGYALKNELLLARNFSWLKAVIKDVKPLRFIVEPSYGFFACIDTSQMKASCQELTVALLKRKCAIYPSDGLGDTCPTSYIRLNFSSPYKKHFLWLKEALPDAIKEAETRIYKNAVVDFFASVGSRESKKNH